MGDKVQCRWCDLWFNDDDDSLIEHAHRRHADEARTALRRPDNGDALTEFLTESRAEVARLRAGLQLALMCGLPPHDVSGTRMWEEARAALATPAPETAAGLRELWLIVADVATMDADVSWGDDAKTSMRALVARTNWLAPDAGTTPEERGK